MTTHQYLNAVKASIIHRNGNSLADLLTYQGSHSTNQRILNDDRLEDITRQVIYKPWDELVTSHLLVCQALSVENYDEAFKEQMNAVQSFNKILQTLKDDNWPLRVLYVVSRDLRLLAVAADKEAQIKSRSTGGTTRPHERVEKAADLLMQVCLYMCSLTISNHSFFPLLGVPSLCNRYPISDREE